MMTRVLIMGILLCSAGVARAQPPDPAAARRITLDEAVALALEHNHLVRIATLSVDEKQEAKNAARGAYFPKVDTATSAIHLSDTQLIAIPAGGLGAVGSALIPPQTLIINQGGVNATTFGIGVAQPLTQLFKIKAANDVALAETHASVAQKHDVEDSVVLKVHQIYYAILVNDARRNAVEAKLRASDELQGERVQQVKYGSALDAELIESRAYSLQAKQELLSTNLQLSDLHMQFNDLVGLPLTTQVALDSSVAPARESCDREECI